MRKIYIAGKITGDKNYKAKFAEAVADMQSQNPGCRIINPAVLPEGRASGGAKLEHDYCIYTGKPIIEIKEKAAQAAGTAGQHKKNTQHHYE